MQKSGTEDEASTRRTVTIRWRRKSILQPANTPTQKERRRQTTKEWHKIGKSERCWGKERAERYRSLQQKWKVSRKSAVRQVLDGKSDAKCQIDPKVIEEMYAERFESVGPTVDLSNYPGPFTEPPVPPTIPEKKRQWHAKPLKPSWQWMRAKWGRRCERCEQAQQQAKTVLEYSRPY